MSPEGVQTLVKEELEKIEKAGGQVRGQHVFYVRPVSTFTHRSDGGEAGDGLVKILAELKEKGHRFLGIKTRHTMHPERLVDENGVKLKKKDIKMIQHSFHIVKAMVA